MDYNKFRKIGKQISWTRDKMKKHHKGGIVQFALLTDLFSWLNDNGGYVFLSEKRINQKTQNKHIETYITKYGIKFQVINKYEKDSVNCINRIIKIL